MDGLIALDWDGTYTMDPAFWDQVMALAPDRFVIVTCRYDNDMERVCYSRVPVYYTGRKAKRPFMEALGIKVSIWIDDNPVYIIKDVV